jgi:hypothetical protein
MNFYRRYSFFTAQEVVDLVRVVDVPSQWNQPHIIGFGGRFERHRSCFGSRMTLPCRARHSTYTKASTACSILVAMANMRQSHYTVLFTNSMVVIYLTILHSLLPRRLVQSSIVPNIDVCTARNLTGPCGRQKQAFQARSLVIRSHTS